MLYRTNGYSFKTVYDPTWWNMKDGWNSQLGILFLVRYGKAERCNYLRPRATILAPWKAG
jgi:hypothetical protein